LKFSVKEHKFTRENSQHTFDHDQALMYYRRCSPAKKEGVSHKKTAANKAIITISLMKDTEQELYWDSAYAIALALMTHFPERNPEEIGLIELAEMIETLPGFKDEPVLATEQILMDIQSTWYEELDS
jgi:FeS assembly protein IscX